MAPDTRLSHRIFIAASPDVVWAAIADLEAVQAYNPTVSRVSLLPGPSDGVGARRSCATKQGEVVERVIGWDEPTAIEMQLVSSPWPVMNMRWRTEIMPRQFGTDVTQELSYAPSLGVLGTLLNALVMRRVMNKTIASVFDALKVYCEKKDHTNA
jgi:ribosome-associated toxin RatA of RatAB toxin-antitoxin module